MKSIIAAMALMLAASLASAAGIFAISERNGIGVLYSDQPCKVAKIKTNDVGRTMYRAILYFPAQYHYVDACWAHSHYLGNKIRVVWWLMPEGDPPGMVVYDSDVFDAPLAYRGQMIPDGRIDHWGGDGNP